MSPFRGFLRQHSLVIGLVLMFAFTWPIDLAWAGVLPFEVPFPIYLFLGWGFIAAALLMTGLTLGRSGVITLLKRYLIWRVGWRWYAVAFLLYPAIFVSAIALNAAWTGTPIDFGAAMASQFFGAGASLPLFILPFFLFEAIANGEEMGWRGYVLPRLQARHTALVASLILGLIWGVWHLPKFLGAEGGGSFGLMMVKVFADAILYTWLYNNTRGSLLLVTIFHAAGNTAAFFLPMANTMSTRNTGALIIAIVLVWLAAAVVTAAAGPERLARACPGRSKRVDRDHSMQFSHSYPLEPMMVKQIAKISWKGVAMVIGFVVIVMSTPSALDLGSGVSTLGLGLAALDLDSISRRPL